MVRRRCSTLPVCTASEMGLLGVASIRRSRTNGFLYLYLTHPPGGDPNRCAEGTNAGRVNRVVRVTLGAEAIDPATLVVLVDGIRTDRGNHDGGALRIGPDGLLYIGTGDTGLGDSGPPGAATNPYSQDLQHLEGKILRIALDGSAPPDNPFVALGGNAARVWAYGLRNPFRIAFDPITPGPQLLWVGDVGQNTLEEIDVVRAGDDLGWPQCEGYLPAEQCPGDSVGPIYVYDHPGGDQSVSVTGGMHYDGAQFDAQYRGDYFFGDYGLDKVYRARVNETRDDFLGDPTTFASDAGSPVEFLVGPDGALYWVAVASGAIVRVTQGRGRDRRLRACPRPHGDQVAAAVGAQERGLSRPRPQRVRAAARAARRPRRAARDRTRLRRRRARSHVLPPRVYAVSVGGRRVGMRGAPDGSERRHGAGALRDGDCPTGARAQRPS